MDVEQFGKSKKKWLSSLLKLPNGIPSHDTFGRVFSALDAERYVDGKTSVEIRYYISSLAGDAERLLEAVRGHWGVENSVHWTLDVCFGEDDSRVRKGSGAEMFAALRRMALNMLKQENSLRVGIAAKRKRAGWDHDYLL